MSSPDISVSYNSVIPIRIVLVDDHQIVREGLACRLRQEVDFEVVGVAASSPEAYACIKKAAPHVVISDLHRPGDNGLITTGEIRRANPDIKILILTGDTRATAADDALIAGAHGIVRKTAGTALLVTAVREVVAGKPFLQPHAANLSPAGSITDLVAARERALTRRDLSVLKCLADGLSYKEIADQLHVSVKSVDYYRAGLVKKTGCATRAQLVRYAVRMGIVAA